MAIDFQQIYEKIKEIALHAQERKETLENLRKHARHLFNDYADKADELRRKLDSAVAAEPGLRCAVPLNEPLDARIPLPPLPAHATLIAADGSQINPDRHAAVQFGLVNVGAIVMELNSGKTPEIFTDSRLFYGDELLTEYGTTLSEGTIALRRDLAERTKLAELAKRYPAPVITFADGPIELWGNKDPESAKLYEAGMREYLSALSRLQANDVVTAGYVDKPGANLVVRLLEVAITPDDKLNTLRTHHPLLGVSDLWLFGERERPLLRPGERSAVFELQSKAKQFYKGMLGLHFFYLNVGTEGHPYPVRVEIPKWVAEDKRKLDMLHAVLVAQCRILGSKPYPYLLHRSHEVAVVSFNEKRQIAQMLTLELRRHGVEVGEKSAKQSEKDVSHS